MEHVVSYVFFLFFLQVAILVDDMIDTGSTLMLAARTLHEKGAKSVHALISHGIGLVFFILVLTPLTHSIISGLLSEANLSLIDELPIAELVVCTSTPPDLYIFRIHQ